MVKQYKFLTLDPRIVLELCVSAALLFVYLSGAVNYTFVLAYSVFLMLQVIFAAYGRIVKDAFLVPVVVFALLFDISHGGLNSKLILAVIILIFVDASIRKKLPKVIIANTKSGLFLTCQKCKYLHSVLVSECNKCEATDPNNAAIRDEAIMLGQIFDASNRNGKTDSVNILYQIFLPKTMPVYVNGIRVLRNYLFLTNKCVAIVKIMGKDGWSSGEVILYEDITTITGDMNKLYISKSPFLTIKTKSGDVFQVVFSSFDDYKRQIMYIQELAKKINPGIIIEINLPDMPWKSL